MHSIFLLIYFAVIIVAGITLRRRAKDSADFFLARRSAGVALVTGSMIATIFGAFAVMGVSGLAWQGGLTAGWYLWGGVIGLGVLGCWGLRRLDIEGVYTLPELLGRAYGPAMRRVAAALIALAWISLIAAQLIAVGKIARFVFMDAAASGASAASSVASSASCALSAASQPGFIIAVSALLIGFACFGGQRAVMRTDCVQALFIVAGLAALLIGAMRARPGALASLPEAGDLLRLPFNKAMMPGRWTAVMLTFGVPFLVGPDIYSRLFSGRGRDAGRRSVLWVAAIMIPLVLMIALLGVLARAILPERPGGADANTVLLEMARLVLAPAWGGLLTAGLLAAVMSTANTCLLTVSTLVCRDLLDARRAAPLDGPPAVRRARWVVLIAGAASLGAALYYQDIVPALMNCYKVYSPAVLAPFGVMLLWPGRRFSSRTGLAALLCGVAPAALGLAMGSEALQLIAFAASAAPIAGEAAFRRLTAATH
ncbi:MAG: sodium:solute symporter family protein [Candidatus Sumerlaeota bacterium]|nr:sodium:solute symporter family protein [Candidatus Sumerlaeota bacterium]